MIDSGLLKQIEDARARHEFLTFMFVKTEEPDWRCGVVQNSNTRFISFYDFSRIRDPKSRARFMAYADEWWWESGMSLPIDAYIGKALDEFQYALCGIPKKNLSTEPIGPIYSLADQYLKRIKKRRIDLINRRVAA